MAEEKDNAEAQAPQPDGKAADTTQAQGQGRRAAGESAGESGAAPQEAGGGRGGRYAKRGGRHVPAGVAYVTATFNNTIVTITDARGAVVAWSSAGRAGFKGSRKSTAFAASVVGQEAARQVVSRGMREVEVRVQGPGAGRESAVRALQASGLNVTVIKDVTPMPHNGCRPRKRRRV